MKDYHLQILGQVADNHLTLHNNIKRILNTDLVQADYTAEKLAVTDIPSTALHVHHEIIKLLKSYEYVAWIGNNLAFFHGYSGATYATFRNLNQKLNLAMKELYAASEEDYFEDKKFSSSINQLFLKHLTKMLDSKLYSSPQLSEVIIKLQSNIKETVYVNNENQYVTPMAKEVVTAINATFFAVKRENEQLKSDLENTTKDLIYFRDDVLKRVEELEKGSKNTPTP